MIAGLVFSLPFFSVTGSLHADSIPSDNILFEKAFDLPAAGVPPFCGCIHIRPQVFDFDNDGWLDIATFAQNGCAATDPPCVTQYNYAGYRMRNLANGSLAFAFVASSGSNTIWQGATSGDMDNDGLLDMVVAFNVTPSGSAWLGVEDVVYLNGAVASLFPSIGRSGKVLGVGTIPLYLEPTQ
jgi:hypothetical protein